MTRKHFIKLAELIKSNSTLENGRQGIRHVLDRGDFMDGLCDFLRQENPNFDEIKFRQATGEIIGEK